MGDRHFCTECNIYHDRSNKFLVWFNAIGMCRCAASWREMHEPEDDERKEIERVWKDFARNLIFYQDTFPMLHKVVNLCGCVTHQYDPTPKVCRACMVQRQEDRYNDGK